MYLIAGLGNPGARYFNTRHNVGFTVIDKLSRFLKVKSFKTENNYTAASVRYNNNTVVLLKPLTFMNRSGIALREFTDKFDVYADSVLIIYDDVNLDFGSLRLRPAGSDGGQKGMYSIIYELGTEDIPRLRIGIRNSTEIERFKALGRNYLVDYVLSEFTPNEIKKLEIVIENAMNAALSFIEYGIKETMNKFNKNFLTPIKSALDDKKSPAGTK
jgi:PTH1 family peptidyl-tRNA hydrolase